MKKSKTRRPGPIKEKTSRASNPRILTTTFGSDPVLDRLPAPPSEPSVILADSRQISGPLV